MGIKSLVGESGVRRRLWNIINILMPRCHPEHSRTGGISLLRQGVSHNYEIPFLDSARNDKNGS